MTPPPPCHFTFRHIVTNHRIGYAVKDIMYNDFELLMQSPEIPLQSDNRDIIKNGNTAFLVKTDIQISGHPFPVAYKRVRRKNLWKKFKSFFQTNHALHCFNIGNELLDAGIATPRPLVVMVPHRHQPNHSSYLAVEWAKDAIDLESYCKQLEQPPETDAHQKLKEVAISLGRLLGKMHAANFSHRDLKYSNLLVQISDDQIQTMVIDLDGATRQSEITINRRCRNLSRLALDMTSVPKLSQSNTLRFLKSYLKESALPQHQWKKIWRTVGEMVTLRKHQKQFKAA